MSRPWRHGVAALAARAAVVADAPTVAVGITGYPVTCKAAEPLAMRLARTAGITVPAAGIRLGFGECGPGAVWVVGSAPDAVAEILRRVVEAGAGDRRPRWLRRRGGGKG